MIRRPPRSTRTDTLFPYTTLFRSDSRSVALFLLQQGADPNDSSGTGATTLMVAAMEGRWHMVELLLEHGADVNAHTPDRLHTALRYSMIRRAHSLVALLLGDGAEVDPLAQNMADKRSTERLGGKEGDSWLR